MKLKVNVVNNLVESPAGHDEEVQLVDITQANGVVIYLVVRKCVLPDGDVELEYFAFDSENDMCVWIDMMGYDILP